MLLIVIGLIAGLFVLMIGFGILLTDQFNILTTILGFFVIFSSIYLGIIDYIKAKKTNQEKIVYLKQSKSDQNVYPIFKLLEDEEVLEFVCDQIHKRAISQASKILMLNHKFTDITPPRTIFEKLVGKPSSLIEYNQAMKIFETLNRETILALHLNPELIYISITKSVHPKLALGTYTLIKDKLLKIPAITRMTSDRLKAALIYDSSLEEEPFELKKETIDFIKKIKGNNDNSLIPFETIFFNPDVDTREMWTLESYSVNNQYNWRFKDGTYFTAIIHPHKEEAFQLSINHLINPT